MSSNESSVIQTNPETFLELKLVEGLPSMGVVTVTNTSGKIIAIKMKSNAGKHIIAKPSIFIMGVDETHDVESMAGEWR